MSDSGIEAVPQYPPGAPRLKPSGIADQSELGLIGSLQKSMVLASMRAPHSGVYVVQDVCGLAEHVDVDLLRRAWRLLSQRHTSLRTSIEFSSKNPEWGQVHEEPDIAWQELDWTAMDLETQQTRLSEFLRRDCERGFDFHSGVPIRFAVVRTSRQSCTLIWTSHHALLDGRSYAIAWREWLALYDGLVHGEQIYPAGPGAPCYGASQPEPHDTLKTEQYWRNYFEGLSQTTDYVVDRVRPASAVTPEDFAKETLRFSEEWTQEFQSFARRHEISVNNLVQAAWALLLSRYSSRSDVVFGVTLSGRSSTRDNAAKIGFFINTLPFRIGVDPESSLAPWLKQIRSRWMAIRQFGNIPLDQVWKWSGLPPGMPPFESVVVYENESPQEALQKLGGHWRNRTLRRLQRTDSSLALAAYGSPHLTLEVVFDPRLFRHDTMAALAGHLKTILDDFVAQPNARLPELKMLTAREERWLLQENNRTRLSYPPQLCVHELFEQQAQRSPRGIALDCPDGSISYAEVNQRSNRLARYLRDIGAAPEDLIAICMNPCAETVIAILAVLKAGAAFLPLDPALPAERLLAMLADARPKLVLCDASGAPRLSASGCPTVSLDQLQDRLAGQLGENLSSIATSANAAYAIYTSGSSGKPKAVVVAHGALVNHTLAAASIYGICESDRRLQFASIGSDMFIAEIFNYLASGATLVFGWVRRKGSVREFLRYLDERGVTIAGMPSAWWHEWVGAIAHGDISMPRSLRAAIIGMERANPEAFLTWKKVVGTKIRLFNAYGPTETTLTATVYEAGSSPWEAASFVPIGKPLANVRVYVLDREANPLPVGVAGELYIGGLGVARGYLNSPQLTARSFLPDRFDSGPASRVYRTGDLGFYLPDGNLVFLGRADRQVKIRGFRVELEEIEAVLAAHPDVGQCAVVIRGEQSKEKLIAFLSRRRSEEPSPDVLRSFLAGRLPDYMLPAAFVTLPEMPMTGSGKIDRQSLPPYDAECLPPRRDYRPPSTLTEKRLAVIWREVLGVSRIGAADNFFELGGDSLDATRLITHVEALFGKQVPLASLWRAPTLARMAALLDGDGASIPSTDHRDAVVPLQPHGARIPFFCFPGADENPYYFRNLAQSLGQDQPFYVIRDPRPINERGAYTVEEVAERSVAAIRSVQDHGPYVVGGHCYGGAVAFEVARQLVARGEDVGALILFEAPAPGYPKVLRHWRKYCRQAILVLRGAHRVGLDDLRSHLIVLRGLFKRKAAVMLPRVAASLEDYVHPNARAGRSYVPKSLSCEAIQFIAADEWHSTLILDDPRLAWEEFIQGEFVIRKTPGKAAAIFEHPHVPELARQLRASLEGVNAGSSAPE
jgi:amino acid adenylation domain-containing protein